MFDHWSDEVNLKAYVGVTNVLESTQRLSGPAATSTSVRNRINDYFWMNHDGGAG